MKLLPENGMWDRVIMTGSRRVSKRNRLYRMMCAHKVTQLFTRIDYRSGPGSFGNTYQGSVCCQCGGIVNERKVL